VIRGLLITLGVLVGVWALAILALILLGRRSAARQLATLLPNLVVLFRGLLRDPDVPRSSKLWIGFAVAWLVSPIDLIPEFIPLLGPLDDAVVAALVLRHVVKRTDRAVLDRHWRGNPAVLDALVRNFRKGTGASPGAVEP
jgi:uncharacterized membrane protein YkvA (DUF1232 family)